MSSKCAYAKQDCTNARNQIEKLTQSISRFGFHCFQCCEERCLIEGAGGFFAFFLLLLLLLLLLCRLTARIGFMRWGGQGCPPHLSQLLQKGGVA